VEIFACGGSIIGGILGASEEIPQLRPKVEFKGEELMQARFLELLQYSLELLKQTLKLLQ